MVEQVLILTAPSGQGKTTACLGLVSLARSAGYTVSGLLSVPLIQGGLKTAILLRALATGEERVLARLVQPDDRFDPDAVQVGIWRFDPDTIAWGQEQLTRPTAGDILLLDEIGPLELVQGRGLTHALPAVRQTSCHSALITIRPGLVEALTERLTGLPVVVVHLTAENRGAIPAQLFTILSAQAPYASD